MKQYTKYILAAWVYTLLLTSPSHAQSVSSTTYSGSRLQVGLASDQNGLTTATWTIIALPAATIDSASGWNATSHLYTIPVTGKYNLSAVVSFTVTDIALSQQTIALSKNGKPGVGTVIQTATLILPIGTGTQATLSLGPPLLAAFTAGDTIELDANLVGSANLNVNSGNNITQLTIEWVAP